MPLHAGKAHLGQGKHDEWRAYMTVLVVNHGIIKSISILTTVMHTMIKFDVDTLWDCFCQEVLWTLAIW
jgi:hypothetical protein